MSRRPLPVSNTVRAFLSGGVVGGLCGLFWREVIEGVAALFRSAS